MANEEMWDKLFKRVDFLKATLKPTETDARDALIFAVHAYRLVFVLAIRDHPSQARRLKDVFIRDLQQSGLSRKRIEAISNDLIGLCDMAENT
jgi:hypothetical protein